MEARFLKKELQEMLGTEVFLDSDGACTRFCIETDGPSQLSDLRDLANLLNHVRNSQSLVILQSAEVLQRPWCLLEVLRKIVKLLLCSAY